jgi:AbrB family looped-hinge helix DNA binding protein
MKKKARINRKGQITAPHEIRRALGVSPGDHLLFEKDGSGNHARPVRTTSPFEKYRGIDTPEIAHGRKAVLRWLRDLRSQ